VRAGVVEISGDPLLISSDSLVAATSSLELSGLDEELGAKVVVLPVGFLDASALLRERCAARRDVGASSFTAAGRGGLPPAPDQPLGSTYRPQPDTSIQPASPTLVISCAGGF
jgi:large exoprotein involved in heme utilization and adhesion